MTLRNEQVCKRVYHVLYYPYKKNVDVARLHIKSDLENRKDAEEWAVHALFRNEKLVCQGAASRDSGKRLIPKNFHLEICDFSFGHMHRALNVIK